MEFDFVTWSIWAVGFAIWITWIVLSARELLVLLRTQGEENAQQQAEATPE